MEEIRSKKDVIINKIEISQNKRSSLDIQNYRDAIRSAERVIFPRKTALYDIFEEAMLDAHLTATVQKRLLNVNNTPLEFVQGGKVNEEIGKLVQTDKFGHLLNYIVESRLYGHSLIEIGIDDGILQVDLIPRKHVVAEKGLVIKKQWDTEGIHYRDQQYSDWLIEAGEPKNLGLLVKASQYIIFKRNVFSDYAQACQVFGMATRIAKYDSYDDKTRQELELAMKNAGSAQYIVIPKGSDIEFLNGNTIGSEVIYTGMIKVCDEQVSQLIINSTMTLSQDGGSYAQAKTHQDSERQVYNSDKLFVRTILNDQFIPILGRAGYNIEGGQFLFKENEFIDKVTRLEMDLKLKNILDISDDYFYETYNIPKPVNKEYKEVN